MNSLLQPKVPNLKSDVLQALAYKHKVVFFTMLFNIHMVGNMRYALKALQQPIVRDGRWKAR